MKEEQNIGRKRNGASTSSRKGVEARSFPSTQVGLGLVRKTLDIRKTGPGALISILQWQGWRTLIRITEEVLLAVFEGARIIRMSISIVASRVERLEHKEKSITAQILHEEVPKARPPAERHLERHLLIELIALMKGYIIEKNHKRNQSISSISEIRNKRSVSIGTSHGEKTSSPITMPQLAEEGSRALETTVIVDRAKEDVRFQPSLPNPSVLKHL